MITFYRQIAKHAGENSTHSAFESEDLKLNYSQLLDRINQCVIELSNYGINKYSVVGLTISNESLHLLITLSLFYLGSKQITLSTCDTKDSRKVLANQAGVNILLITDHNDQLKSLENIIIDEMLLTKNNIISSARLPDESYTGELYLRTSGTTGVPKITPFNQSQIAMQAANYPEYKKERLLKMASVEYNNGKRHRLYSIYMGGTNIFRPIIFPPLLEFCLKNNVTAYQGGYMNTINQLTQYTDANGQLLPHIKVTMGGSKLTYKLRSKIKKILTNKLYYRYSTTECATISSASPNDHDEDETVGYLHPNVSLEIVDENNMKVGQGEFGEIRIKSPGMATHYLNNEEATARHFRDGWFYPGDIGMFNSKGALVIAGRKDDMMIMNTINIFPAEIENVLMQHPNVKAAAAAALPSDVHGEIPVALVEIYNNNPGTLYELSKFARKQLSIRTPRKIISVDKIPYTNQGKIKRQEIITLFKKVQISSGN